MVFTLRNCCVMMWRGTPDVPMKILFFQELAIGEAEYYALVLLWQCVNSKILDAFLVLCFHYNAELLVDTDYVIVSNKYRPVFHYSCLISELVPALPSKMMYILGHWFRSMFIKCIFWSLWLWALRFKLCTQDWVMDGPLYRIWKVLSDLTLSDLLRMKMIKLISWN